MIGADSTYEPLWWMPLIEAKLTSAARGVLREPRSRPSACAGSCCCARPGDAAIGLDEQSGVACARRFKEDRLGRKVAE
jgi:hypothetical protein